MSIAFRNSKGVTLIELLVVVGIILLLASLLLPLSNLFRERALEAKCAGNLRAIGAAWGSYVADQNGKLPPAVSGQGPWYEDYWTKSLAPYLGFPKVLPGHGDAFVNTVAFCPGNTGKKYHRKEYSALSYIPNGLVGGVFNASGELLPRLTQWPNSLSHVATTIGSISHPSRTLLYASAKQEMLRTFLDASNPAPYMATHFRGGGNILFADGHVGYFVPTDKDGNPDNTRANTLILGIGEN